jgi:polyisoprenoid-binding protein YceI
MTVAVRGDIIARMKSLIAVPLLLCILGAARARVESPPAASAEEQTWVVDPVHSSVVFRVKHANASWFYGFFTDVKGEIVYDPQKPEAGKVSLEIATESVMTRDPKRDAHLKSPNFFDAKQNPKITFRSTKIAAGKDKDTFQVTGDLQVRGVTKSIELEVEKTGERRVPWTAGRLRGDARGEAQRLRHEVRACRERARRRGDAEGQPRVHGEEGLRSRPPLRRWRQPPAQVA